MSLVNLLLYSLKLNLSKTWRTKMAVARNVSKNNGRILPDLSNEVPGTATKATPRSLAPTKEFRSPLAQALMTTLEPLVRALDDKPALLMEASADNGQTQPSVNDVAMKIMFGTVMSFFHRQNVGEIRVPKKDKNGRPIPGQYSTYDNNKERMDKSQEALSRLEDIDDIRSFSTLYWAGVNEKRYDAYNDILYAFGSVYREIFNEEWRPMEQQTVAVPITTTDAEKSKWADRLREMKAQRVA